MWSILRPLFFKLDAERAHHLSMSLFGAAAKVPGVPRLIVGKPALPGPLRCERFGLTFENPVGLAAGFDKDARWFRELALLGFGSVEVGTLTAHAQPGNPRPRLFRLPEDRALLNRFGFNNAGSEDAASRLSAGPEAPLVLGINIGKSKITANEDAIGDYLLSLERVHRFADYLAVNVSSPNTAGLRDLQAREPLLALLSSLNERNAELGQAEGASRKPLLVKIAPDLSDADLEDTVDIALECGVDGIIATNTTISRDELRTPQAEVAALGAGGVSGAPLTARSRRAVARLHRRAAGRLPIVGVGGIMCGEDAWQMLRAGASLVQIYSGFIYGGPRFVNELNGHIALRLSERSTTLDAVIGEAAEEYAGA